MGPSKITIVLCSVAVVFGALASNPAAVSTSPPATGLCTIGFGVGAHRGTVVEPCQVSRGDTQSLPPSSAHELLVEISSFNTNRIPKIDGLRMVLPSTDTDA